MKAGQTGWHSLPHHQPHHSLLVGLLSRGRRMATHSVVPKTIQQNCLNTIGKLTSYSLTVVGPFMADAFSLLPAFQLPVGRNTFRFVSPKYTFIINLSVKQCVHLFWWPAPQPNQCPPCIGPYSWVQPNRQIPTTLDCKKGIGLMINVILPNDRLLIFDGTFHIVQNVGNPFFTDGQHLFHRLFHLKQNNHFRILQSPTSGP